MCAKGGSVWGFVQSVARPPAQKPNLKPPVTTTEQAIEYQATLEKIDQHVQYLMTLYLSQELTPAEIRKAKRAGVVGT
jgi:dihydroorotase